MRCPRCFVALVPFLSLLAVTTVPAHAQQMIPPSVPIWAPGPRCASVWPPLGFYVDSVSNDGRYIVLEDSTIWEVRPTDRAGTAAWKRDQFVRVDRVVGPTEDYEWLFTNGDQLSARAAVRLAGRLRSHQ